MHQWTIIDTTYLYDGSIEGLLTVVYTCLEKKEVPRGICTSKEYVVNLLEEPELISTDFIKSSKVLTMVEKNFSNAILYHMYTAFLSGGKAKSKVIVYYLIYAFKYGNTINYRKSIDCVVDIQRICRNVFGEAHRMYGFLRFTELQNHFLYATYESDNNILEYLARHFKNRLQQEIWIIHDKKRKQVALYNRQKYIIVDASTMDFSMIENNHEDAYLLLWKEYFKRINIKERKNARCQRQFMPKKYWQYLPETQK